MMQSQYQAHKELKLIDATTYAGTTLTTTMTTLHMTAIAQGDAINQREGNEAELDSIEYRLSFNSGDATQIIRYLIVSDRQCNGATFAQTDLFANATDPTSALNEDNKSRFVVHEDQIFSLDTLAHPLKVFANRVKLRRASKVYFTGSGNAIGNLKSNALFMVFVSDSGGVPNPSLYGDVRLYWRDT